MKTEDIVTSLVPQQHRTLTIIGKQLRFNKKIQAAWGVAVTADEFHVPRDGSLYDAVERVRPGGTIRIAAGEYRIDRVIHINKPLSIIGEGKELTVLVSSLEEHYVKVQHDGYFAVSHITLKSEDQFAEMLDVSCLKVGVNDCDFIGDFVYETETFTGAIPNKYSGLNIYHTSNGALSVRGETSGCINGCVFSRSINGLRLHEKTTVSVIDNIACDNRISGIMLADHSAPTLKGNLCERNGHCYRYWYSSGDCAEKEFAYFGSGISITGNASGEVTENILRANFNRFNILLCDAAAPYLFRNCCEGGGLVYCDATTGTAEENDCNYIRVSGNASPHLLRNRVSEIRYGFNATGTAEENVCNGNSCCGIFVSKNASPRLLRNLCEGKTYGIQYFDNATGTAEENVCRKNKYGISLGENATPLLLNNNCDGNEVAYEKI